MRELCVSFVVIKNKKIKGVLSQNQTKYLGKPKADSWKKAVVASGRGKLLDHWRPARVILPLHRTFEAVLYLLCEGLLDKNFVNGEGLVMLYICDFQFVVI